MPAKSAPNKSKSAQKRVRQNVVITLRNKSVKSTLKTMTKKVTTEVNNKSKEAATDALKQVVSALDKAGRKGILHKNTASRKVSRLTKLVNSLTPSVVA